MTNDAVGPSRRSSQLGNDRDMSWEKELAPRINRACVTRWVALYVAWTAFLGYLAFQRWFGGLQ